MHYYWHMRHRDNTNNHHRYRTSIAAGVRKVRLARHWSQAELARRLGVSQEQMSRVEHAERSLTAEQLIALMTLSNTPIEAFLPPGNADAEEQNALVRLGALHLREAPDTPPAERYTSASQALVEVLGRGRDARVLTALAPVLVWNIDAIDLPALHRDLDAMGRGHRLGWFAANVRSALTAIGVRGAAEWARRGRRTIAEIDAFVEWALPRRRAADGTLIGQEDRLDPDLSSARTIEEVRHQRSPLATEWGVVTVLRAEDFAEALRGAHAAV